MKMKTLAQGFALTLTLLLVLFAGQSAMAADYSLYGWVGDLQYGTPNLRYVDVVSCADGVKAVEIPQKIFSLGIVNYQPGWPVEGVGENAFKGHKTIARVTVPTCVERIEAGAFSNCAKLTSVTVYAMSTTIAADAFSGSAKVTLYGYTGSDVEAFAKAKGIPFKQIGSIDDPDDPDAGALKNPDPDTVLAFEKRAAGGFAVRVKDEYAGRIGEIVLPAKTDAGKEITAIADRGFYQEKNLTRITFTKGLKRIGDEAFRECGNLKSVTLPEGLTSLGEYAFRECRNLTQAVLPSTLKEAAHCAFAFCDKLDNVKVPGSLKTLPEWMFCDNTSLTDVTLYSGIERIENYAFFGCSALRTLTIPASVKTMTGSEIFEGCSGALVIRGAAGGAAERYAAQYGLNFEATTEPDPVDPGDPGDPDTPGDTVIKKITLSQKKAALLAGREGVTLTATVVPAGAQGQGLVWSSSKPAVATVLDGVVTPLAPGKTKIVCKAETGKAKAVCTVTVKPVKATALVPAQSEITLSAGESETLTVTVEPTDATYKTLRFVSGNKKIATVDQTGLITAVKPGTCAITVSLKGFPAKLKIPVTVR